jgi:16S rRNA processing protein RimM
LAPRAPQAALPPAVEMPADAVEVGRVIGAWGLDGGIRVKPFSASPEALFSSKRWYLAEPALPRPGAAMPGLLRIVRARWQGDAVVATAQELQDRDAAEALRGASVLISRRSFPTPGEGEHYWVDLIGLEVFNREGRRLGLVDGLIETGPHCVLSVRGEDPARAPVLIPFVDAYVDRVDETARRIDVDWGDDY